MKSLMGLKQDMQNMNPYEFEKLISNLWNKKGYDIELRSKSRDRGVDFEAEKTGYKEVVQVKRNSSSNNIGSQTIRNYATLYQQIPTANSVVIVASGEFTKDGKQLADDLSVTLYDGDHIISELNEYNVDTDLINSPQMNSDRGRRAVSSQDRREAKKAVGNGVEALQNFYDVYDEFMEKKSEFNNAGIRLAVNDSINAAKSELKIHIAAIEENRAAIDDLSAEHSTTDFSRLLTSAVSLLEEYKKYIAWTRDSHTNGFQSIAEQNEERERIKVQEKTEEHIAITEEIDINDFTEEVFR